MLIKKTSIYKRFMTMVLALSLCIPSNIAFAAKERNIVSSDQLREEKQADQPSADAETDQVVEEFPDQREQDDWDGMPVIYWNPGIEADLSYAIDQATASIATNTAAGKPGSDHADGLAPERAVKSLNTAIRKAEKMSREMDLELSDVIIYAMNPMVVSEDLTYTVRGKGITVMPWEGRDYDSDLIFVVDGGQLTLNDIVLMPEDGGKKIEETSLIHVTGGAVQLGGKVESYGMFVLDYTMPKPDWEWATQAEAQASQSEAEKNYQPVIELMRKFDLESEYVLDLIVPDDCESVTAVKSLYSDDQAPEAFMESFKIMDPAEHWRLIVEERVGGVLRDTTEEGFEDTATPAEAESFEDSEVSKRTKREAIELTQKTLVAARTPRQMRTIYWNPGGPIDQGDGNIIPAGHDTLFDGIAPGAPKKTLAAALIAAGGGRIVCMQTIDLQHDVSDVIPVDGSGNYILDGGIQSRVTLSAWSGLPRPVLKVPDDQTVIVKDMNLVGLLEDGRTAGGPIFEVDGGQVIFESNVKMPAEDPGYLQIRLSEDTNSKTTPMIINDNNVDANLFFRGINNNLEWRYVDVVVSGTNLIAAAGSEDAAGDYLEQNVRLSQANSKIIADGGTSQFAWTLRKDREDDDGVAVPDHLELFATYYYDGVYIDGQNGHDNGVGATCIYPVKTFARAKEILILEMARSIAARQEAFDAGRDWQSINVPKRIYICDTIPFSGVDTWDLPDFEDIDKTPIEVEIVTHLEGAKDENDHITHQAPEVLIHISGAATELTLGKNIFIKNIANDKTKEMYGLVITDGAKVMLTENADISGLSLINPANPGAARTPTLGTHVLIGKDPVSGTISSGSLEMAAAWTGSIQQGQYGIHAYGAGSRINMHAGSITGHRNKHTPENPNQDTAGVYLKDGKMTMTGGVISDNHANLNGAGVYLDGNAEFTMTKGTIRDNRALMLAPTDTNGSTWLRTHYATAKGVGVYVGGTSKFTMGISGNTDHSECLIADQFANGLNRGIGVYVDEAASFTLYSGTISGNKGRGSINNIGGYANDSQGGGICSHGELTMYDGLITENGWNGEWNDDYFGGGIYLEKTSSKILGGTISKNRGKSWGGGILVGDIGNAAEFEVSNVLIEENNTLQGHGGGIGAVRMYTGNPSSKIIIKDSKVVNNIARESGGGIIISQMFAEVENVEIIGNQATNQQGGGLFAQYTIDNPPVQVTQTFRNCLIEGNTTRTNGGGVYSDSYSYFDHVTIKDNKTQLHMGGGMYVANRRVYSTGLKLIGNEAALDGGGIYVYGSLSQYHYDLTVDNNKANQDGGGIYTRSGSTDSYTNVQLTNNEAGQNGGGMIKTSSAHLYLSETEDGKTQVTGNTAKYGGGFYVQASNLWIDFKDPIKNKATGQGNNVYVPVGVYLYFMQAEFLQPDDAAADSYSVYITAENRSYIYLDPLKVSMPGTNSMYVNSPDNYIHFFRSAGAVTPPKLSISLNPERFTAGNIVIRPNGNTRPVSQTHYRTAPDGLSTIPHTVTFPPYMDVSTPDDLEYARGGALPPRTVLAGAEDPDDATKRNIVLLGKGVYLDGVNGADGNSGTDPDHAVKTFERALERLEEYTDASNSDPTDQEGFPPFIYICGTVTVDQSATWQIDISQARYTTASRYRAVETAAGRTPELPQIKRYTGFIKNPMVKVTGSSTTLTIPDLIMDGMMHSVDKAKQTNQSFMFEVTDGTLVLEDKANIRNNNLNMIKVTNGTMNISSNTPDSDSDDGFKNRQIELTRGDGVDLNEGSVMTMSGYASILFLNKPEGLTDNNWGAVNSNHGRGVILRTGSDLTMADHSKIVFTDRSIVPNVSGAIGVVMGNEINTGDVCNLIMKDHAMITRTAFAVYLYNYNMEVMMQDDVTIKDNTRGIYSQRALGGAKITLAGRASIFSSNTEPVYSEGNVGRYYMHAGMEFNGGNTLANTTVDIQLLEDSSINFTRFGIHYANRGNSLNVEMRNNASITELTHTNDGGIDVRVMGNINSTVNVAMYDNTHIDGLNWVGRGIFIEHVHGIAKVSMNDSASMNTIGDGIYFHQKQRRSAQITMNNDANITCLVHGWISNYARNMDADQKVVFIMNGDSWMSGRADGQGSGIRIFRNQGNVEAYMKERARVFDFRDGVRTDGLGYPYLVSIEDNAWIGASATGRMVYGMIAYHEGWAPEGAVDMTGRYQFKVSGNALIGGDGAHNSTAARRGVEQLLFYTNKPATLELSGSAKLQYAGTNGIQINPGVANWLQGTTFVTIKDQAIVSESGQYGILSNSYLPVDITIQDDAVVNKSAYGIDIREHNTATIRVLDQAQLGAPSNTDPGYFPLKLYGKLELNGTAQIDGVIYLRNGEQPITLSAPVPSGDPEGKYQLQLAESYVGQKVVIPDGTTVTDATTYDSYFVKTAGDGLAANKALVNLGVDIILAGENNVYISQLGSDDNNGVTPATSVRTFKQARKLLREGYFEAGADIIVCYPGSDKPTGIEVPLTVEAGDEDWSFDEGGYITNQNTNDTWKPVVTSHENFWGRMIDINPDYRSYVGASEVVFKNITIDGFKLKGDKNYPDLRYRKTMISIYNGGTARLEDGAVLQNARTYNFDNADAHTGPLGIYVNSTSTLIMDGGVIKDLVHENFHSGNNASLAVTNEGRFELRRGSIENCNIIQRYYNQTTNRFSIIINRSFTSTAPSNFIMTGGTIQNNEILLKGDPSYGYAGALAIINNSEMSMRGGQIINNKGGRGSAVYIATSGKAEFEGGRIRGNTTTVSGRSSTGTQSPVNISGTGFILKGGGCIIDDPIYLYRNNYLITLSANIQQVNRRYQVYLNFNEHHGAAGYFDKGSAVVQPDGVDLLDASQYLRNFEVCAGGYILDQGQSDTRLVGTKNRIEDKCLILMRAVYLDSDHGAPGNDGRTPQTAVDTFARAKTLGQGTNAASPVKDYFVIYISGRVVPVDQEEWQLADVSYMCRYTGFTVYDANGEPLKDRTMTYRGFMIEPAGNFKISGVRIYGRRSIDGAESNGESIIRVLPAAHVVLNGGTLASNLNQGVYMDEYNRPVALLAKGGAVLVEVGGLLEINDIKITDTRDGNRAAIYQKAEEVIGSTNFGRVMLNNRLYIENGIYLCGKINMAQAYVEAAENFMPVNLNGAASVLGIQLESDYSERPVVKYPNGVTPGLSHIELYKMDDAILAIYDITNRVSDPSMIELQLRQVLYVGGPYASDGNNGTSPQDALQTFKGVYHKLSLSTFKGANVYIVGTIEIPAGVNYTLINEEYIQSDQSHYQGIYRETDGSGTVTAELTTSAQVYFKRYSKPHSTSKAGFDVATNEDTLIQVNKDANLTLNGIYLDGHADENVSKLDYLSAPGVAAKSPLITVMPGGYLESGYSRGETTAPGGQEPPKVGLSTETLFTKNYNINEKTKIIGNSAQGNPVVEGTAAGIEILSDPVDGDGVVLLKRTRFTNLSIGDGLTGGSDIYQNGELSVQEETTFQGSVYLEGLGDYTSQQDSRVIKISMYGVPVAISFDVVMRDPYNGRPVVAYPTELTGGPATAHLAYYLITGDVNDYFALQKRADPEAYILELVVPQAVYIDGQNGSNANTGLVPNDPVETLARAYQILKEKSGQVIYIVDTVEIQENIEISSSNYVSITETISLPATTNHIDIRRYVKPLAGENGDANYNRDDFEGTLFKVMNGYSMNIKETVNIDGHYLERNSDHDGTDVYVNRKKQVVSPLFEVETNATLALYEGVSLNHNHNDKTLSGADVRVNGGAINNHGTLILNGAVLADNTADYGAGIYQAGIFELLANAQGLKDQEIYLTTEILGAPLNPQWGEDHVITTAVWIEAADLLKLDVNMDHPVAGRPVVRYSYHDDVDPQYVYYQLGTTVPDTLYLVESKDDNRLLELQDWKVLDVTVPEEVFLMIRRSSGNQAFDAAVDTVLNASPDYQVVNNGRYQAKVTLTGFVNKSSDVGITHDLMRLVPTAAAATAITAGEKDLYLAIKGIDQTDGFSGLSETSLDIFAVEDANEKQMGILDPSETANFRFIAAASKHFMNKYDDDQFPISGTEATAVKRIEHIRNKDADTGLTSPNHARAKYKMTYRIELVR